MSTLSREFHIIGAMRVVKSVCRKCTTCKRYHAKTENQLMGQLPEHRVNTGAPFDIVGTDFAGPIQTKYVHTRKPVIIKSYICIFVCMATKAVHLEPVSDLTTDAFLACLHRFVSRRGRPTTIYSDNGSNFVGASRELNDMFQLMCEQELQSEIVNYCTSKKITWKFSPERAPHFGGLWGAAVKSMKYHLRRLTKDVRLHFKELQTVLCQIEAALNSRPLMPLYSHSSEAIDVLTAGHFLIGRPLEAIPENKQPPSKSLPKRWALCQYLAQQFWER